MTKLEEVARAWEAEALRWDIQRADASLGGWIVCRQDGNAADIITTATSQEEARAAFSRLCGLASAKAAVEALREPTDAMYRARPISIPERPDWLRIWGWQIDAILSELPP